jgi:hypothetical protein
MKMAIYVCVCNNTSLCRRVFFKNCFYEAYQRLAGLSPFPSSVKKFTLLHKFSKTYSRHRMGAEQ